MSIKDQQRSNSRQHVIPCPLKRRFCGFTLIELLAAVLIIGILAAIAWPAYNKAVVNAKATQLITAMRAVIKGENSYFVTQGEYALDIAELAINFNLPRKNVRHLSGGVTLGYGPAYGPNMWAIYTHSAPGDITLNARFDEGKYIACGFWYGLEFVKKPNMEKKLFCFEGAKNTKIKPGEFCMDVMSSEKLVFQSGGSRWYSLGY